MKGFLKIVFALLILSGTARAQLSGPIWQDDGTTLGRASIVNMTGAGVTCTISGATVTCAIAGAGGTPTLAQVYDAGASTADSTMSLNTTAGGVILDYEAITTTFDGLRLRGSTIATAEAPNQYPPALTFEGAAWLTGLGVSVATTARLINRSVTGSLTTFRGPVLALDLNSDLGTATNALKIYSDVGAVTVKLDTDLSVLELNGTTVRLAGLVNDVQPLETTSRDHTFLVRPGTLTAIPNTTNTTDAYFDFTTPSYTWAGGGTVALQTAVILTQPTYAASSAQTITTAAVLNIVGAPIAGTNMTITNAYALRVAAGASLFGGAVTLSSGDLTLTTGSAVITAGNLTLTAGSILGTYTIGGTPTLGSTLTGADAADINLLDTSVGTGQVVAFKLENTTAATSGNPKYTPEIEFSARGWDSTAGSSKEAVARLQGLATAQDGNPPYGEIMFFQGANSATPTRSLRFGRSSTNPASPGGRIFGDTDTPFLSLSSFGGTVLAYNNDTFSCDAVAGSSCSIKTSNVERIRVADITTLMGGASLKRTAVNDAAYVALTTDIVVAYTAISAARTVTGPAVGGSQWLCIKDESGSASVVNTITFQGATGNIDGAATKVIVNAAYGSGCVYSNGTNWFTLQ